MKTKYIVHIVLLVALFDVIFGAILDEEGYDDANDTAQHDAYMYQQKCYILGDTFEQGPFIHPTLPCRACECCLGGVITCTKKFCPKAECGLGMQIPNATDPCCNVCKPECDNVTCPSLGNCPKSRYAYANDSCCPECGCKHYGEAVPDGDFGHPCSTCSCNASTNTVDCHRHCPTNELQCVDPQYDISCNLYCPERSCRRGSDIIPAGKVKIIGRKLCVCAEHWYPRAFCAFTMPPLLNRLRIPVYAKCARYPTIPSEFLID